MTTAQLLIVCAAALAAEGAALYAWDRVTGRRQVDRRYEAILLDVGASIDRALARPGLEPGEPLTGKTVVVATRQPDGQSVRGVVHGDHADKIVLRDAVYYRSGGGEQAAKGTVELPKPVSTVQVLPPPSQE